MLDKNNTHGGGGGEIYDNPGEIMGHGLFSTFNNGLSFTIAQ